MDEQAEETKDDGEPEITFIKEEKKHVGAGKLNLFISVEVETCFDVWIFYRRTRLFV